METNDRWKPIIWKPIIYGNQKYLETNDIWKPIFGKSHIYDVDDLLRLSAIASTGPGEQ